ncbi:MAG TPA: YqeG family HAD IIIA-type phosphatase [Methylomusa anaerophila]|uniref:Mitochondrial PGP phosphatase n=1 Tax=Methylomusa anaerophila TaxID=1930071 RepID=A0A348ANW4_9FIRM|nr:YqeG family HAD IIIA-type phosphatase [Methylomusa anaerophila]BBB92762.1 mitochondrial PGP phosphatase [Methylomusa anaerophila]HML87387.1 YqeG family HAD IIIA-type phosphatase [Methylomusa anaerophila]
MYYLLAPNEQVNSLGDINIINLGEKGICGIILDLDNTIIPWNSYNMSPEIVKWIGSLTEAGFKIILVSNSGLKRVGEIALKLQIPYVAQAYKPAKLGFYKAATLMGLDVSQVAVVGDQLFTDIFGGNRTGFYTIWVKPLSTKEFLGTKITRYFEKLAVRFLRARGFLN